MNKRMETSGMVLGFISIVGFSLSLPATRIAVTEIHPSIIGLGRSVIAAIIAAGILLVRRESLPKKSHINSLLIVAATVVFGFPLFSAWAMQKVHASHGGILLGIVPLATAAAGALRAGDRPSISFWVAAFFGSTVVVGFALIHGDGRLQTADLLLLVALISAAIGYAEGARLARELGGWQVICWALLIVLPITCPLFIFSTFKYGISASPAAWISFGYVSLISQLIGFFGWYHALAIGGVARVSQIQLLQPFMTLFASTIFLDEKLESITLIAAFLVLLTLLAGRKASVRNVHAGKRLLPEPLDRSAKLA
jgi:drug/metabolite transporter (DMT)-like permease